MTRTFDLFATPSFLGGVATTLDIGNTLTIYNESENGTEADFKALRSDWLAVGDDISKAIVQWETYYEKEEPR